MKPLFEVLCELRIRWRGKVNAAPAAIVAMPLLMPVFGDTGRSKGHQSPPPPADTSIRLAGRSALKGSRSPDVRVDEETGSHSYDTPSRPPTKRNASFSAQLEEMHFLNVDHDQQLLHRNSARSRLPFNACTATWGIVTGGFALMALVLLVFDSGA